MRFCSVLAVLITLLASPVLAQTRAVQVSLRDQGFSTGLQLRSRESAAVFFTFPNAAVISSMRLHVKGQIAAPTLMRGSILISANGQPVDAFAIKGGQGLQPLDRDIPIDTSLLAANGSLNLRFETELLTSSDPCSNDTDPTNVVSIFPASSISFDANLPAVQSLSDAVQLLPNAMQIVLPPDQSVRTATAKAALHLAVLMIAHGASPRIETIRDDSVAAVRLKYMDNNEKPDDAAVLERNGNKLDIVIDPSRDVVALTRLWQMAPATIMGKQATASRSAAADNQKPSGFREFTPLPPAQSIRQTGEWTLNFPLLAEDGRPTKEAYLKLAVAPDWSDGSPIVTVYLNGQLVKAERLRVGDNNLTFALPSQALNFSNTLRVQIERASDRRFCIPLSSGHAVQILPGSGVRFGDEPGVGFARIAHELVRGGVIVLPKQASDPTLTGRYLLFAAKILAAFGSNAEDVDVTFDASPADSEAKPTIVFEVAGADGLQIPIPSRAEHLHLQPIASASLAGLFSNPDGHRLRVVLAKAGEVPAPATLYLRDGGSNALVSDSGVVWHDAPAVRTSIFERLNASTTSLQEFLSRYGLMIFAVFFAVVVLTILGRRALVVYFRGRRK